MQSCGPYYNDGTYNNRDYKVNYAKIDGSNGMQFDAYEVFPFSTNANAYQAIMNKVAYKFPEKTDWQLYYFDGNTFNFQLDISADKVEAGEWTVIEEMNINQYYYESPQSWVFIKKSDN